MDAKRNSSFAAKIKKSSTNLQDMCHLFVCQIAFTIKQWSIIAYHLLIEGEYLLHILQCVLHSNVMRHYQFVHRQFVLRLH